MTDSITISNAGVKSTPIITKIKEKELSISDLFNLINKRFDVNDIKFDVQNNKFDKLSSDVNELKEQNEKFDTKFNEQINNKLDDLNKRFDVNDAKFKEINGKMTESQKNIDDKLNKINIKLIQQLETVSYTHLDVYKRQHFHLFDA